MAISAIQTVPAMSAAADTAPATSNTDKLANEQVFLQMLVAQIKNQNPLNPADGVQFMTQLAQFSQLEQLIGIRKDLDGVTKPANAATSNGAETPAKSSNPV